MTNSASPPWSRRRALLGALGLGLTGAALAGCGRKATPTAVHGRLSLDEAVAGVWRDPADKARDLWRHPAQTLQFFGLKPRMTVVELWPGNGWYTDILAPYLAANGGTLYAAQFEANEPSEPAANKIVEAFTAKMAAKPKLYGKVAITSFGPTSGPIAPAGSADLVLFLRNVHNWMAGGVAEKAFSAAFAALKPGGVLGIEEHRADPGGVQDAVAANGYVQEAYVRQLAMEAGFVPDGASEINANPKDTKDYPFGVWTLAPTRLTAPRGEPSNPDFDRTAYDAIGESDRMTLRFKKPAA